MPPVEITLQRLSTPPYRVTSSIFDSAHGKERGEGGWKPPGVEMKDGGSGEDLCKIFKIRFPELIQHLSFSRIPP
ncbi:hypothetical protein J2129_001902 [Methanofollis sp. W23]|uniref:hypothetical protein n=1 Tax=Methanofollis sp. W23 TaxID=2817849 RepID=UPI001AE17566|nr:hypothetical protein [Methanofollis sp. W23]MBP2146448.1 hypothetical protein [Methanofollis sp. W23]